jgi:hypothetical protein
MITPAQELENFTRLRQMKSEGRREYLLRVARKAWSDKVSAADSLSPKAYAWVVDAAGRIARGDAPLEFDDERIQPQLGEQLFDLLESEDQVEATKRERRNKGRKKVSESRNSDHSRIAQYLLCWPGVSNDAVARELSSQGWTTNDRRVREVRAELRRALSAMKVLGFSVRNAHGERIIDL